MDPSVMMNGGDFRLGNTPSSLCNLAEILPYHVNFGNAASFGLGQLIGHSASNDSDRSIHAYMNNGDHAPVDVPMDLDRKGDEFQIRKRREEDVSSKPISSGSPSMQSDCNGKRLKMLGVEDKNSDGSCRKQAENITKLIDPPKQD